jgi:DNA-binding NarL/FixJ family response regulator
LTQTRVFIVASSPALRAGLRALLSDSDTVVVGEASALDRDQPAAFVDVDAFLLADAAQTHALAAVLTPDRSQSVVLIANDIQALPALRTLAVHGWGIAHADASAAELSATIRAVSQGLVVLPAALAAEALTPQSPANSVAEPAELEQPLTPREIEVLERVSRGLPSKLIAQRLEVSESTIKFHLSSIYAKLGVASRTEAVSRAARLGLITL